MANKKIIIILLVLIAVAASAYLTYKAPTAPYINQTTTIQTNATVSLTNSSILNTSSGTAANASISNSTLSGNVTKDQNYSVLSNGNIISSP